MRFLAIIVLASACGFSPNSASVDARTDHLDGHHDPIDASHVTPIDAFEFHDAMSPPAFDPAMCPSGYTNHLVTASPNSRYRVTNQADVFSALYNACKNDHPGWTHLVVLDTTQEATQIETALNGNSYYVGAVQPANQAMVTAGWLQLTGEAVPADLWQTSQPNDDGDNFENNEQNLTAVDNTSGLMNDVAGSFQYLGVCECDGKPIAATAEAALN
ncbi:MAG: hypothetical protein ABI591_00630 [Kofleriaceae bacterium]